MRAPKKITHSSDKLSNPENAKEIKNRFLNENDVKGGIGDNLSLIDISKKFNVSISNLKDELKMGIKVELEHTKDESIAKDIAMDHLTEIPDYYTRLNKMETSALNKWKKKELKEKLRESINNLFKHK